MKFLFLLLLLIPTLASSNAPDFSKRFGLALGAGYDRPIQGNKFDDRADGEFVHGLYGRYQFNRSSGLQLGYTRYEWSSSPTAERVYDAVYLHRLAPRDWFTPIWGAGLGLVDIANYNVDDNLKLELKVRAGVEFETDDNFIFTLVLDYQYVNKMPGEANGDLTIGEMYSLATQAFVTYFFK